MSETRIVSTADIERCPKHSLSAGHYRDDGTCMCRTVSGVDLTQVTDEGRRQMIEDGEPQRDLAAAEAAQEKTWDTAGMTAEFDVIGFAAPFVTVRRKSDGKLGSLEFMHRPRVYFGWEEVS
jgi:hypothetical protein